LSPVDNGRIVGQRPSVVNGVAVVLNGAVVDDGSHVNNGSMNDDGAVVGERVATRRQLQRVSGRNRENAPVRNRGIGGQCPNVAVGRQLDCIYLTQRNGQQRNRDAVAGGARQRGAAGRGVGHAVAGGDPNHSVGAGVGAGVGTDEKVITLLPVPLEETATNNDNSGDQQTERHTLSAAEVIIVQVIPSDEVITLLVEPVEETATNNPNSGDQQTEFQ